MKKLKAMIFVNSITFVRVLGTFLMPFVSTHLNAKEFVSYIVLLLLTDSVDGIMARRLKVSTVFGSLLDAAADKLFGIATLCVLARFYPVMWLPVVIEILITLINTGGAAKGSTVESSMLGKFKTWILGICIVIGFLVLYANEFVLLFNETTKYGSFMIDLFHNMKEHELFIVNSLAFISGGCDIMVAADYRNRVKVDVKEAKANGINAKEIKLKKGKDLVYALFDHEYYIKTLNKPLIEKLGNLEVKDERKNKRK